MHYYYHHIGDFIKDTSFLTNEEIGIYLKLMWLYYDSEKPLDIDFRGLAFRVNAKNNQSSVEMILNLFFKEMDGAWHHTRIDKEIKKYRFLSESGKKGAEKRWGNNKKKPPHSTPNATLIATNNQEPITNNHIKTITPDGVSDEVFNDFLKMRKAMKAPVTETAIKALKREAEKAKINLEGVMTLCCQNGWRGFKAEWLLNPKKIHQDRKDKNIAALHELTGGLLKPKDKKDDSIFQSINTIDMENENARLQQG